MDTFTCSSLSPSVPLLVSVPYHQKGMQQLLRMLVHHAGTGNMLRKEQNQQRLKNMLRKHPHPREHHHQLINRMTNRGHLVVTLAAIAKL